MLLLFGALQQFYCLSATKISILYTLIIFIKHIHHSIISLLKNLSEVWLQEGYKAPQIWNQCIFPGSPYSFSPITLTLPQDSRSNYAGPFPSPFVYWNPTQFSKAPIKNHILPKKFSNFPCWGKNKSASIHTLLSLVSLIKFRNHLSSLDCKILAVGDLCLSISQLFILISSMTPQTKFGIPTNTDSFYHLNKIFYII